MQDLPEKGLVGTLIALLTWFAGSKAIEWLKGIGVIGKAVLDSTAAQQKIKTDAHTEEIKVAATARTEEIKLEAAAETARDRIEAEAMAADKQRLNDGQWRILEEQRKLNEATSAQVSALESRMDSLQKRLDTSEERRHFADVAADVAHLRADDLSAEIRKAHAERSILNFEIASLNRQLLESVEENRELKLRMINLQIQLDAATNKIAQMTAIMLRQHPNAKDYPEMLASEQAIEDFLTQVSPADDQSPSA